MRYRLYLMWRRWLCRRGVHDYEFVVCTEEGVGVLECFYCSQTKKSKPA